LSEALAPRRSSSDSAAGNTPTDVMFRL